MPTSRKPRSPDASGAVTYQLKITLSDVRPAVWRRVQVRGDMNLGLLHAVIQVTMGWTNSHLHQFLVGDEYYSDPTFHLDGYDKTRQIQDENKALLVEVAPRKGARFWYEYDFGDSWYHELRVEKIEAANPSWRVFAKCLGGARACPPENSGGPFGYEDLLEAFKHPERQESSELIEWLDPSFDPKALQPSPDKVNQYLSKLKWPRTTISQLASVLMQRDSVRA